MKKEYVAPSAEKMNFDYTESVVASGTPGCPGGEDRPGFIWFPGWFLWTCG